MLLRARVIKERTLDITPLDTTRYCLIPFAEFAEAMASVEQVCCTQAWLGYADVLFVDLGDFDPPRWAWGKGVACGVLFCPARTAATYTLHLSLANATLTGIS